MSRISCILVFLPCTRSLSWFSYCCFSHFSFLSSGFVYLLCTYFFVFFSLSCWVFLLFLYVNKCFPILCYGFWISMWLNLKILVTLQKLSSFMFVFSMLGCKFWSMKPGRKIKSICKGRFGQTMNLCPNWKTPCMCSIFFSMCTSLSRRGKI